MGNLNDLEHTNMEERISKLEDTQHDDSKRQVEVMEAFTDQINLNTEQLDLNRKMMQEMINQIKSSTALNETIASELRRINKIVKKLEAKISENEKA